MSRDPVGRIARQSGTSSGSPHGGPFFIGGGDMASKKTGKKGKGGNGKMPMKGKMPC